MSDEVCKFCGAERSTKSTTGQHFACNSIQRDYSGEYARSPHCEQTTPHDERQMANEVPWDITISRLGEALLTIGHNSQSGKMNLSDEEEQTLYDARDHLDSFLGASPSRILTEFRDRGRGFLHRSRERETTERLLHRYCSCVAIGNKSGYEVLAITCALHLHCL